MSIPRGGGQISSSVPNRQLSITRPTVTLSVSPAGLGDWSVNHLGDFSFYELSNLDFDVNGNSKENQALSLNNRKPNIFTRLPGLLHAGTELISAACLTQNTPVTLCHLISLKFLL